MPATLTTFESILKEFYLGPVIEEINNEVLVLELFEKATVDWNGRVAIVPVHVSRNTGVSFVAESGALPVAGDQGYSRLQIHARFQYGRFQITGPAISAAQSGGKGSFIGYVDAEMKKLVNDVRDNGNAMTVNGCEVRGFLNQHLNSAALGGGTGGAQNPALLGTNYVANTLEYTGDFTPFLGVTATVATWIPIRLIRMDTFQDIAAFDSTANLLVTEPNWMVSGFDTAASTITISFGADIANARWQTSDVTPGFAIAVGLRFAQADSGLGAVGVNMTAAAQLNEPSGMYSNLASPGTARAGETNPNAYFSLTRDVGFGAAATSVGQMRGIVLTQATALTHPRTPLTLNRMQQCMDAVHSDGVNVPIVVLSTLPTTTGGGITPNGGGGDHDLIMMNPATRQQYTTLLQGTLFTGTDKARGGDGGFLQLSYSGVTIKTGRAIHRGALLFVRKDTWAITELEAPGFADLDGSVLSRLAGVDAYEGFYRWYWNLVCKQPNTNVLLVGVNVI
jgi:hypothetical protein